MRAHSKQLAGIAYLVGIALLIWVSVAAFNKQLPWQGAAQVSLRTTVPGLELNPHSDVKFQGLRIGEVRSISSDGVHATINLALEPDKLDLLPANIDAAIVPKTLFGEKFVDLRMPAHPSTARLVAGGIIRQSTTSVEIGAVFNNLVPVLDALKPQQLSTILNSLADALDGRGRRLAETLNQAEAFLTKLSPHLDTLTQDITRFATTADIYAKSAPDLVRLISATTAISKELLVPQEQNFRGLLDQVTKTSGDTKHVLAENAQNLIRLSARSRAVLALLDRYSAELPCLITGLHRFGIISNQAIGARGPVTNLIIDVAANNRPYQSPKDLPGRANNDANNGQLPLGVPSWQPHCPEFSAENLALQDVAPGAASLPGTVLEPRTTPAERHPGFVDLLLAPLLGTEGGSRR